MAIECKDCPYYGYSDSVEYEHCCFIELRGEPTWLDIPPCDQDDD